MKLMFGLCVVLFFTGCASLQKPVATVPKSPQTRDKLMRSMDGKNPKEVKGSLGVPFIAGYEKNNRSKYMMIYPISDAQTSTWDVMTNDSIECVVLEFNQDTNFKNTQAVPYWSGCSHVKDFVSGYDDSLFKD